MDRTGAAQIAVDRSGAERTASSPTSEDSTFASAWVKSSLFPPRAREEALANTSRFRRVADEAAALPAGSPGVALASKTYKHQNM